MRSNDNSPSVIHFNVLGYLVCFSVLCLLPLTLLAEKPSEITRFTSQREKSPGIDISTLQTATQPEVEVTVISGIYQITASAIVDAPANHVRYVLTDFSHLYKLNPSITESELLAQDDDGSARVRTRINGCASYFCEELDRVEKVKVSASGEITAEIIPRNGQFRSGQTRWQIEDMGERSKVIYIAKMEPDIYIPPVVSKFLVKKAIKQEALICFTNLEKISSTLCQNLKADDRSSLCN